MKVAGMLLAAACLSCLSVSAVFAKPAADSKTTSQSDSGTASKGKSEQTAVIKRPLIKGRIVLPEDETIKSQVESEPRLLPTSSIVDGTPKPSTVINVSTSTSISTSTSTSHSMLFQPIHNLPSFHSSGGPWSLQRQ